MNLRGEQVLKLERDLQSFPYDPAREVETVDDRHYLKLKGFDFTDGIFEVKVLSRVQQPPPFPRAQGFIGVYFRAQHDDFAFESIYLRPNCGRSAIQAMRNHFGTVLRLSGVEVRRLAQGSARALRDLRGYWPG